MTTPRSLCVWTLIPLMVLSLTSCQASRILCVFPSPSLSHLIIHATIAETLAQDGHNVTVIGTVPASKLRAPHVQYIHIEGPMFNDDFANEMLSKQVNIYTKFAGTISKVQDMANVTMNDPKMLEFLRSYKPGDFDALILGYFMNDFMLGLGAHFQCPIIVSFMVQPIFSVSAMVANPPESSYVPSLFMGYKQPMDFWTRVKNFAASFFEHQIYSAYVAQKGNEMYR
ncbi:UDP-glycosyltransferase UGT4-like [Musca vetustissima]|uniref:UDP-glycosyltransferase UGT4-like n=1 Tax=Musca vetustissima TaxID=27455 RepID=UPI002AB65850|nr:UDP-glycosyltransferase UGT4-like [Musca vetustissima]